MSDSGDKGVDDLLEEVFHDTGKSKREGSGRTAATSSSSRDKERGYASPEPKRGSATPDRKRRSSASKSRSRSPRRSHSKKSKRDTSRDRSSSRKKDRSSKSRRRSGSGSDTEFKERKRSRRDKSRSRERGGGRDRSRSPYERDRRGGGSGGSYRNGRDDDRGGRDRDRSPVRRRSRSRSPQRGYGGRGYQGGYGGGGGYGRYEDRSPYRGNGGGYRGGRRSPPRYGGGGFGGGGRGGRPRQSIERARSVRSESPNLPPEERDQRTVFAMQLAQSINAKDCEKFFSSVGRVRDVRLIVDSKTRRSKGIAYIEFYELEAVPLALGLHGQKLKGCPMNIQPTHAEKNRAAMALAAGALQKGPMRLYVGSLHFNITEEMLKDIFEPFGKLDSVQLMMDAESGRSRGYAFITFRDSQDAKRAMEQLNGFELAGRAMKIGHVTDRNDTTQQNSLDNDDMDRAGFDLGPTGRLQLMAKLAEGTGMKIPQAAAPQPTSGQGMAPIATQCFMLSNMFDPKAETDPNWSTELRQEIIDECSQYGGVVHVDVDKDAPEGNVYVKSVSIAAATMAVQNLHGRFFAGRMITANYIPTLNYHQLFNEAMKSNFPLAPSRP